MIFSLYTFYLFNNLRITPYHPPCFCCSIIRKTFVSSDIPTMRYLFSHAIGRLCLYLFIDKSDDFILLVGMIPVDFGISLKPGELLAHVFTAMRLYLADGFSLVYLAIEIGKHFFVAYGSQRGESLLWIYAACFCLQTFVHHHQYTLVDAIVEFGSVAVQTYLDDAERTLLLFGCAERSIVLPV